MGLRLGTTVLEDRLGTWVLEDRFCKLYISFKRCRFVPMLEMTLVCVCGGCMSKVVESKAGRNLCAIRVGRDCLQG